MKKIILIGMFCALTGLVFAQKGLNLGVQLTPQGHSLLNSNDNGAGDACDIVPKFGFAGGLNVGYGFTDHVGVQLGLIYSWQPMGYKGFDSLPWIRYGVSNFPLPGTRTIYPSYKQTNEMTTNLSYFKIPVLFRYNSSTESKSHFIFTIGPQFSFLTGASYNMTTTNTGTGINQTMTSNQDTFKAIYGKDFSETYKMSIDLAMGLGMGIRLSDEMNLNVGLNINYGLVDIENKDFTITSINGTNLPTPIKPWENGAVFNDRKYIDSAEYDKTGIIKYTTARPSTNYVTVGLSIGVTYNMPMD